MKKIRASFQGTCDLCKGDFDFPFSTGDVSVKEKEGKKEKRSKKREKIPEEFITRRASGRIALLRIKVNVNSFRTFAQFNFNVIIAGGGAEAKGRGEGPGGVQRENEEKGG